MGFKRQQAFSMLRIYIIFLGAVPEVCLHTLRASCFLLNESEQKSPLGKNVQRKQQQTGQLEVGQAYAKTRMSNIPKHGEYGPSLQQHSPCLQVSEGFLVSVIISTGNYVFWSLVPFGCFDAFRKGSGLLETKKNGA